MGHLVPRFALWLRLRELGWDPERLPSSALTVFCDRHLDAFLAEKGYALSPRQRRRLRRRLAAFDPHRPSPYERAAALERRDD